MKSYDEIANNIFERRDKYIAKQKRKKRIIIYTVTPALCCCIVSITSLGLWKIGFFSNKIPVSDNSQTVLDTSDNNSSADNTQNSSSNELISDDSTPSNPYEDNSSVTSDDTSSNIVSSEPPVTENNYFIDSIDKINFYSAKKIISEKSLFPKGMNYKNNYTPNIISLNNEYVEYPIDRNKVFTTTMVTYFTVELKNEKGFLAQKLGGTGLVEIVVTENDIEDIGQMITFKRNNSYYTCFANGGDYDPDSNRSSHNFSSHKYIDGFNIVKNLKQENYKFTVHYNGSKVIGFECAPFGSTPFGSNVDDVTFIDDYCVVIYARQTFTIDELEVYFKNEIGDESL